MLATSIKKLNIHPYLTVLSSKSYRCVFVRHPLYMHMPKICTLTFKKEKNYLQPLKREKATKEIVGGGNKCLLPNPDLFLGIKNAYPFFSTSLTPVPDFK